MVYLFLTEHPFVFRLLHLAAYNREALWKCSPILRSALSILMFHYETQLEHSRPRMDSPYFLNALDVVRILSEVRVLRACLLY